MWRTSRGGRSIPNRSAKSERHRGRLHVERLVVLDHANRLRDVELVARHIHDFKEQTEVKLVEELLSLRDIPICFDYILWNQQAGRLTTAAGLLPTRKPRLSD